MDGRIPVFSVMFGSEQIHAPEKIHQEYTPISSASAWEDGAGGPGGGTAELCTAGRTDPELKSDGWYEFYIGVK